MYSPKNRTRRKNMSSNLYQYERSTYETGLKKHLKLTIEGGNVINV